MLRNIRSYFYRFKGYQAPLEKYLFPVVLLLYPLIGVNQGLDISDTTYALTNYRFLQKIDPMWAISTFLGNFMGSIIMKLPFAGTMLGMNVYCSLVISLTALLAYYLLQKWMPGWMLFIGLFIAESLCWCPRVILYNYLTYLFFTLGIIFLFTGMFDWEREKTYLLLAGASFGINVMVRFPNIVEAAMIVVLWFYCAITGVKLLEAAKKTLICMAGYAAGIIVPYIIVLFMYGPGAYLKMIQGLFGMTGGASDYQAGGMLTSILEAYMTSASNMAIMIPCMAAGVIMFVMLPGRFVPVKKLLYVAGLLVLVRYYFGRGVFTRNYFYYDSVFQAAMMFVIFGILILAVGSTGALNGSKQEQTLAFGALMVLLITPIGSNNYTFPVINNLFVAAPVILWIMRRLMQRMGEADWNFTWQAMISMTIAVLMIQGAIFHAGFTFKDGDDGRVRDSYSSIPKAAGLATTGENARTLDELYDFFATGGLLDDKVILFGDVPGISYVFDLEPAIDTAWPDLDSYTTEKFSGQLQGISQKGESAPTVVISAQLPEYANTLKKYDILMDYIANHDYNKVFENERFTVYAEERED